MRPSARTVTVAGDALVRNHHARRTHESRRRRREEDASIRTPRHEELRFMTARNATDVEPLDETADHVRGPAAGHLILEYGDYECPYSRAAYRQIQRVERQLGDQVRFAFRHFPLTAIHPHALAASAAAEAATLQDRFWPMHELLFQRQTALEDDDLRDYAAELDLDLARFDRDRAGAAVIGRVGRHVGSGAASGLVTGTPTLFVDGVVHRGGYDAAQLLEAVGA
jgi:protein-disulfide isomerase